MKVKLFLITVCALLLLPDQNRAGEQAADYCLEFDGSSSRAIVEYLDGLKTLDGADKFTFEAWIRPRSQGGGGRGRILQQVGGKLNWYLSDDTRFGFRAGHKAGWRLSDAGAVQYWQWQHIAVVSDGVQMRYYIDGKLVQKIKKRIQLDITGDPLWIGDGLGEDNKSRAYDGWLDELRISNNCLYTAEFLPVRHFDYDSSTVMLFRFDEELTIPFALDATPFNAEIQITDPLNGTNNSPRRLKLE